MEQVEEMCENIILIHHSKNILMGNVKIRNACKENLCKVSYERTAVHSVEDELVKRKIIQQLQADARYT
jgi:ABC-type uncharacterized transport system ATPase subunit